MPADVLLFDSNHQLIAPVEVKGLRETDESWAMERVEDALRGAAPPYLVMVARDKTWFWRDPANNPRPAGWVPTAALLDKYARPMGRPAAEVQPTTLDMIVFDWLAEATWNASVLPALLDTIGFTKAIRDAEVKFAPAA